MDHGGDPLDVDTDRYVTMRQAQSLTRRGPRTIRRWAQQGKVRTLDTVDGVRGYSLDDLTDTEARSHLNQSATRRTPETR